MTQIQINTTQNVTINFTAATAGERILAYLVDLLIKAAYITIIYLVVFEWFNLNKVLVGMDYWSKAAIHILFYLPAIFYSVLFETFLEGQTIGKRLLKIKVVKIDGYQASLADYITRWLFRVVDVNIMMGFIAIISVIVSDKNQRLGDMTAGTGVISLKNNINIGHTIVEDLKEDYVPTFPTVINLSDNDARIIKDTYLAAVKARDYETMIKLRTKVMQVIEIKDRLLPTDEEFIKTVLKDYNYYTKDMHA